MSLKVVHLTPVYPPYGGGIGVAAKMMAEGLYARGWNVEVIVPERRGAKKEEGAQERVRVSYVKPIFRIGNGAVVPQLRKLDTYDIIHLHYPFFGGAEWLLCKKTKKQESKKTKLVLHYHHDADAAGLRGFIFRIYDCLILPRLIKRADRIVVSSMDYARHSRVASYIDERFVEVSFGIDEELFKPRDSKLQAQYPRFQILFVGSFDHAHWFKGFDVLMEAMIHMRALAAWHCNVIGEGELRKGFQKKVADLGLREQVSFLGRVSHAALPEYYRCADCFVFPSVSRAEAFGLVVLEAMASGLPVIMSDLPGVRTLVDESKNGYRVMPCDSRALAGALKKLIEDKELCARMGAHSRTKILARYTREMMIGQIITLYEHCTR